MADQYATRDDLIRLEARLDAMDHGGTRGVAVLAIQMQELTKDVTGLQADMREHRADHATAEERRAAERVTAEQRRVAGRRWLIMAVIAVIAAIDGPLVAVLLGLHGG